MKKHHRKPVPFDVKLIAAALLLLGVTAAAEFSGVFSTDDFVEANVIDVTGNTLVLGRDCMAIVAETTPDQARSIRLGIEHRIDVRPTTHDILVEALGHFGVGVEQAVMTRFEDDIYYAELVLRSEDSVLRLDARPTDAVAVALRTNTTFMINKAVLEQRGQNIC